MGHALFTKPSLVGRYGNAMISRALAAALGAVATTSLAGASAQAMGLVEQTPAVNEIMQGSALAFALRFDQPIDHQRSSLGLVTPRQESGSESHSLQPAAALRRRVGRAP